MTAKRNAIDAIIRYEQEAANVAALTKRIGKAMQRCAIFGLANESEHPGHDTQALWDGNRIKTHLWHAYNDLIESDHYFGMVRMDEGEQQTFLMDEDCPHCLEAWNLIQQRKEARKAFGAAKRAIRNMGRAAIAKQSKEQA